MVAFQPRGEKPPLGPAEAGVFDVNADTAVEPSKYSCFLIRVSRECIAKDKLVGGVQADRSIQDASEPGGFGFGIERRVIAENLRHFAAGVPQVPPRLAIKLWLVAEGNRADQTEAAERIA